jgi:hypothetical protein
MRFIGPDGIPVRELADQAKIPVDEWRHKLGCLERWKFIVMQPGRREGWGSGRGIRNDWTVRLTFPGKKAAEIWPPLFPLLEHRWEERFGRDTIATLKRTEPDVLDALAETLELLRAEFDAQAPAPLSLSANILRVLGEDPILEAEIPRLTGGSPETAGIGWQVKRYIVVEPDPGARRKLVRLSPAGIKAQQAYGRLTADIEKSWETGSLRQSLEKILSKGDLLADGMTPPPGTARAGDQTPALGRRDIVVQTLAFRKDPAGGLPHYPLWDLNHGFGP